MKFYSQFNWTPQREIEGACIYASYNPNPIIMKSCCRVDSASKTFEQVLSAMFVVSRVSRFSNSVVFAFNNFVTSVFSDARKWISLIQQQRQLSALQLNDVCFYWFPSISLPTFDVDLENLLGATLFLATWGLSLWLCSIDLGIWTRFCSGNVVMLLRSCDLRSLWRHGFDGARSSHRDCVSR